MLPLLALSFLLSLSLPLFSQRITAVKQETGCRGNRLQRFGEGGARRDEEPAPFGEDATFSQLPDEVPSDGAAPSRPLFKGQPALNLVPRHLRVRRLRGDTGRGTLKMKPHWQIDRLIDGDIERSLAEPSRDGGEEEADIRPPNRCGPIQYSLCFFSPCANLRGAESGQKQKHA